MKTDGEVVATSWSITPVETRWVLLNWPWRFRLALVVGYFAGINWLIFTPADTFNSVQDFLPFQDKIAHLGLFLTLTLLVRWSLPARWEGRRASPVVPAALLVYAAALEVFQPLLSTSRTFEWSDMACNVAGVLLGWALYGRFVRRA
jgi:VanZ family protein